MASLGDQSVRLPAVAGRFYPEDGGQCRSAVAAMMRIGDAGAMPGAMTGALSRPCGAVVPHAGWVCSGAIAGEAIATLAKLAPADVVVVFGAVHTPIPLDRAALDSHASWRVPSGDSMQPESLVRKLSQNSETFSIDERLHTHEHAVEVEVPFIQAAWPNAAVLPIEVPLIDNAQRIGRETAEVVMSENKRAVFLASSDLTHYGPTYRFTPAGVGEAALNWAMENDRRLLGLIANLAIDRIVPEVKSRYNACGGGAIAAMLEACKAAGATQAKVLRHANSYQTLRGLVPPDASNAVGYAGVIVG
ncbi:MAG TPA: AmmeMemoRadiSam system protein B [Humisphaera sp.]|nr:AmmeMemoRadiSam system protein B [Humisphaera sp.]